MATQEPRLFKISPDLLRTDPAPSDRFVYSLHYIPFDPSAPDANGTATDTTLIAPYKASYAARLASRMPEATRNAVLTKHPQILELANQIAQGGEDDDDNVAVSSRVVTHMPASLREAARRGAVAVAVNDPSQVPDMETLRAALSSDIGYMFLDRTRIRPTGFALGEHLVALSLAPGEEVTLEQRTFSKREVSYEELTDREQTFEMELSSTLTNEMSEGMDYEQSTTKRDSETMNFNISGEIEGIGVDIGPTTASEVTTADRDATRTSVKNSQTASSKVAARNRSQHKITFRVSTENRFETSSRRIIRNPNPFTPVDLHYFKILQRLRLTQERFGVRLCWAPSVAHPASVVERRLAALREKIFKQVELATAGPRPVAPAPPDTTTHPPKTVPVTIDADKWDPVWGNQRYDYEIEIKPEAGYAWDGQVGNISLNFQFSGTRPAGANILRANPHGAGVKVVVHVGVTDVIWFDQASKSWKKEARGSASITVSAIFNSTAVGGGDATYQAALEAWKKADAAWLAADAAVKETARAKAEGEWIIARAAALAAINPLHETLAVMMGELFPSQYRDEIWEIDLWERVFDWKNASVRMYPSWWNDGPARDPDASPVSFLNASWVRLFLPIRPGAEQLALRWIFGLKNGQPTTPVLEKTINDIIADLSAYRTANFGDATEVPIATVADQPCPVRPEKFLCLGQWEEFLPTDGTHLEVLQSTSFAADDDQRARLSDAAKLRLAEVARAEKENTMRDAVVTAGVKPVSTQVQVHLGDDPATPGGGQA